MRKYQTLKSFMISTPNIEKFITANIEKSEIENQNYDIWKSWKLKLWDQQQTLKSLSHQFKKIL